MKENKIVVGYLMSPLKMSKLKLVEKVQESTRGNSIEFVPISPYKLISEQKPHLHILIHRVHDYINTVDGLDCDKYIEDIIDYVDMNNIILLESFDIINTLADRKMSMEMLHSITEYNYKSFNLKLTPTIEINKGTTKYDIEHAIAKNHNYLFSITDTAQKSIPFIVKTTKCVYSNNTRYKMSLYFQLNESVIDDIVDIAQKTSVVIQPFYNHNGILYKLFILGDRWCISTRKSIKNFDLSQLHDKIDFLSNTISKLNSNSVLHDNNGWFRDSTRSPLINIVDGYKEGDKNQFINNTFLKQDIEMLVQLIKQCIPCHMLGVDLIMESNTRNLVLIDINYFPGYDGFSTTYHIGDAFIDLFNKCINHE